MAVAAPPMAMPTTWGVLRPSLDVVLSVMATAPDVASRPTELPVPEEACVVKVAVPVVDVDIGVAEGVAIVRVALSVAITMVLTASVEVGLPIVAGKGFMVEDLGDAEVVDSVMVAVIVRAVFG